MTRLVVLMLLGLVAPVNGAPRPAIDSTERPAVEVAAAVAYSSYLGTDDCGISALTLAVDADGGSYVAGSITGACFTMTPGAFQQSGNPSTTNGFVAKLAADGKSYVWASYVSGNSSTQCTGIAIDRDRNVYVTGITHASNLPVRGGFQPVAPAPDSLEGFVLKLDSSGSNLQYGTYLGGRGEDYSGGISVDAHGVIAVVGGTTSTDFPTTPGAFLRVFPGSSDIGFVTVVDTTRAGPSSLLYSTYFGGMHPAVNAYANAISDVSITSNGIVYFCGATNATDFPLTPGAIRTQPPQPAGAIAGFVSVLDPARSGTAGLLYSTLVGGSVQDRCKRLAIDAGGCVYVAGTTFSPDFPTTPGAFQTVHHGSTDTYVIKLDLSKPGGAKVVYSTLVGGSGGDEATSMDVDASGRVTLGGYSTSNDFPLHGSIMLPFGGNETLFYATVLQLEPSGSEIGYSTLFGGGMQDFVESLALDKNGDVLAVVSSASEGLPTTPGALQSTAPAGPSRPISALIRIVKTQRVTTIQRPSDISVAASAISDDVVGAIIEFPAPDLSGDDAGRATVVFDPPSGSFFAHGFKRVLAYVLVDGLITSVAIFDVEVGVNYDTCVASPPGVRFRIVASPADPIRGAWLLEVDIGDDTSVYSGFADSIREIDGTAVVFKNHQMKARQRLAAGTWKIKVKVYQPGLENPVVYRIDAPAGPCP